MIHKQDVLNRAAEWGLRPDVVEKDYVLGWLLAGFAANRLASRSWVFKGGTCLKKCFFETYRFSEVLIEDRSFAEELSGHWRQLLSGGLVNRYRG